MVYKTTWQLKNKLYILAVVFLGLVSCSTDDTEPEPDPKEQEEDTEEVHLQLADANATQQTKALYSNLWALQGKGFMFGHHDGLIYGRQWISEPGRSDVKEVSGDYPAVFSVDFAEIMDDRSSGDNLNQDRRRAILEARSRGEVILANAHLNNPVTGGDSWDNSDPTVVKQILEGGSQANVKYKSWLDKLADFVSDLRDDKGDLIPIIFRPYHEHTQSWSWWGSSNTTQAEFIEFWRFTVDYLKGEKGVHNLIYAISPQLDGLGNKANLLYRWPGDDYVDFIGMDSYHGANPAVLSSNARILGDLSKEKLKPAGITETGIEGIRQGNGQEYRDYWTKEILNPLAGKNISMVVMWRNKYDPGFEGHHFYGPWIGHSSAPNFIEFYESSFTIFSADLPDMYQMAEGVTVN